jgi:antitoxin component YwqK of YwqJK toxin-antitoxin module
MSDPAVSASPAEAAAPKQNGVVTHKTPEGHLCCESTYVDGRKEGPGKLFYRSGKVYAAETWVADKLNGPTITYYETGTIQAELNYKDDRLDGLVKEYFPSGKLASEEQYVSGLRHGKGTIYNEAGDVVETIEWSNGGVVPKVPAADAKTAETTPAAAAGGAPA